ncbi:3-oxoacyl-[acyl-carrier-protein] synthase III C-terminal domain-containing protein [Legionella cardiaca]|uniref:3-oxoacyl-[acyl-carrier-protein] synthase III C-terminal domain-containing protein n=1 Tax=Legionella cardiaca TaxID=1071983 RepID=A0ABY8ARB5_9GAMM|nr:3-oxoacyl-[acyl-carrier-protein] synthase III C-terminal domain-containing protein [Legionella cardiaca]WED43220.1 3-oxoacyl-[acyl-carrier-protein] synthase III C-terminal domain-containing protein [Legionella cardiaca]
MHDIDIVSIASVVPEQAVLSSEIIKEANGNISPEVRTMFDAMAIHQRYSVVEDYPRYLSGKKQRALIQDINELAVDSIHRCINATDKALNIGLFITITNTAMRPLPCMAYEVIAKINPTILPREVSVINMQNQGCSTLVKAIEIAQSFLATNLGKQALITVAETHTAMSAPTLKRKSIGFKEIRELANEQKRQEETLNLNNLINSYLFGDGAVSLLLQSNENENKFECFHLTNCSCKDTEILHMDEGGSYKPFYDGFPQYYLSKIVPARGLFYSKCLLEKLCKNCSQDDYINDIDLFLIHTGSKKIIDGVRRAFNLESDSEKVSHSYSIINNFGNLSSCSIGFMLDEAINKGKEKGTILLVSFGVGFSGSIAKWHL